MLKFLSLFLFVSSLFLVTQTCFAQETTATISGKIVDEKASPLANASVIIKYVPTNTVIGENSNAKGLFNNVNLRAGGPYIITISHSGYITETFENVTLTLGENIPLNVSLKIDDKSLNVVVISTTSKKSNAGGLNVGKAQIASLPSIGRSLSDFTRLTPQSNNNSFAGTNFRYNNVTLDGAINNDAIGFSNSAGGTSGGGQSGTAGSGNRTNPYSLETIQEVQVQIAPFDVKLGNFTGGSVNAVTKGGGNDFHGSLYWYGHGQSLVGKSVDGLKTKIGSLFYDNQTGFSISGPIIKNKAFFYINGELTRHQEPTFYNVGDPDAAISLTEAQSVVAAFSKYGYDPGSYGVLPIKTSSNKLFARLDFNLNSKNALMLRAIYTKGFGNNLERSSTNFQFSSTDFTQNAVNVNLVAELKTKINNQVSNNLVLSSVNVHEYRDYPGNIAPFVDINGGRIWAGTWREASVYNMKQKTFEFTDNVSITKGINKITLGTHNEFYKVNYGFVNSFNGRWEYGDIASFEANKPRRIRGALSLDPAKQTAQSIYDDTPNPFSVNLLSFYAQDEITLAKGLKVSPGFRVDYSAVGSQPPLDAAFNSVNEYASANPTYSHTPFGQMNNKWLGKATISPRLGFSYDVKGDQSLVIRGGTGIFTGRMPFAWLGYAYTLSGSTYGTIDYSPNYSSTTQVGLAIDPSTLKDTIFKYSPASATQRELNVIDNNFKLPTVWRSNVAVDIKFGKGYKLTLDALYTKTLYDVKFQQINLRDSSTFLTSGPTQTPVYLGSNQKNYSKYSNVYFLTNTTEGYRYNLTAQLTKSGNKTSFGKDAFISMNYSVAYTYGQSKDISNGIRNSFQSNYEVNPATNPQDAALAYSNFDLRNRIVASVLLNTQWNKHNTTTVGFFFSAQSGNPYSYVYNPSGNAFRNGSNASLAFIPTSTSAINFRDYKLNGVNYTAAQQSTDFNNFVNNDAYLSSRKGQYAERNGATTPWNKTLDMKLMHEFKVKSNNTTHSLQLSFDITNLLNLLNNNWGRINFVTNVNNYTVNILRLVNDNTTTAGVAPGAANYTPTYNFAPPSASNGQYYTLDPINSRWQGQMGVRYSF